MAKISKNKILNVLSQEVDIYRQVPTRSNITASNYIEASAFWLEFLMYYIEHISEDTAKREEFTELVSHYVRWSKVRLDKYRNNESIRSVLPFIINTRDIGGENGKNINS